MKERQVYPDIAEAPQWYMEILENEAVMKELIEAETMLKTAGIALEHCVQAMAALTTLSVFRKETAEGNEKAARLTTEWDKDKKDDKDLFEEAEMWAVLNGVITMMVVDKTTEIKMKDMPREITDKLTYLDKVKLENGEEQWLVLDLAKRICLDKKRIG